LEDEDDDEDPVLAPEVEPEDPGEVDEPEPPEETGEDLEVFEGPDGVAAGVIAEFPEADTPVGCAPPPKADTR
jgi:hypothetical protein